MLHVLTDWYIAKSAVQLRGLSTPSLAMPFANAGHQSSHTFDIVTFVLSQV